MEYEDWFLNKQQEAIVRNNCDKLPLKPKINAHEGLVMLKEQEYTVRGGGGTSEEIFITHPKEMVDQAFRLMKDLSPKQIVSVYRLLASHPEPKNRIVQECYLSLIKQWVKAVGQEQGDNLTYSARVGQIAQACLQTHPNHNHLKRLLRRLTQPQGGFNKLKHVLKTLPQRVAEKTDWEHWHVGDVIEALGGTKTFEALLPLHSYGRRWLAEGKK